MTLSIYQLQTDIHTRTIRGLRFKELSAMGVAPNYHDYNLVYSKSYPNREISLDRIFETFNDNKPVGFTGHSLSVSDVIVIEKPDNISAFYVDNVGFVEIPDFAVDHMFQTSKFREEIVYSLNVIDVFEVIQDLDMIEILTQDEIREIVIEAKSKMSLEWFHAIQGIAEDYVENRDSKDKVR